VTPRRTSSVLPMWRKDFFTFWAAMRGVGTAGATHIILAAAALFGTRGMGAVSGDAQRVTRGAHARRGAWHRVSSTGSIVLMPRGKPSPKLAITVDPNVHGQVLAAAAAEGVSVSAWMTEAARRALRRRDGLAAISEWEAQHGRLTDSEMEEARLRVRGSGTPRRGRTRRSA
jgi:hypothetical protein